MGCCPSNILSKLIFPKGHSAETIPTDDTAKSADRAVADSPARAGEQGAVTPPSEVREPPPLDEWLKGRKILTVSQDGSGQFKTIRGAIDAMKPGEAVEVLDRGPYRETLRMVDLKNAGLVSRRGTVIEPGGKRRAAFDGDTADFHFLTGADQFRLSGLSFVADDLRELNPFAPWISFAMSGHMLIEGCRFAGGRPTTHELVIWWDGRGPGAICHIRECLFDTGLNISATAREALPVAIIERNWFSWANRGFSPAARPI